MTNEAPVLSDRQIEVLRAVAKGLSNQEIAQDLTISVNTVRVHLRNIFEKIEVQSRTEATMWAVQQGLITTDIPAEDDAVTEESTQSMLLSSAAPVLSPVLTNWQRIYFGLALLVALVFLAIPAIRPILRPGDVGLPPPQFGAYWSIQAQMPTARTGLALTNYDGGLYIIGGDRTSGPTGLVEILTLETLEWREGPSKPTPVVDIQAMVIDDKIYVAGGCNAKGQATDALEIFDPVANVWTQGQAMSQPLCGYAATVHKDKLYLIGGKNGNEYTNTVLIYNATSDEWEETITYPLKLGYAAATTLNDKIYVAGGYDGLREYADVNVLDTRLQTWEPGPSLSQARGGLGLVTVDNTLLAIGGGWTSPVNSNEQLTPESSAWEAFETPYSNTWRNFGLAIDDTNVYVAGGWNGTYLDLVTAYQFTRFNLFLPIVK